MYSCAAMAPTEMRLPDLRFVPTEDIYPHELHDSQRTRPLVERLRVSGTLRNPPIVTQIGDGMRVEPRYVVLDGANRSTAARAAGWPHLLVQVVRYESPAVELFTWYHALTADARELLELGLSSLPGLTTSRHDHLHARALLARREALACVVLGDDDTIVAHGGRNLHERNELLNHLVHLYQDRLPYTRVTSDSLTSARRLAMPRRARVWALTPPEGLGPGMVLGVHLPQSRAVDVRVDLRGGDVGVTQHLLHDAQIGPAREQVRCEAVPEHVGVHILEPCRGGTLLDELPHRDSLQGPSGAREQQPPPIASIGLEELGPALRDIVLDRILGRLAHGHEPLLIPLAVHAYHADRLVVVKHGDQPYL